MASGYTNNNGTAPSKAPDWSILSPIGPSVAYHASCVLNNKIYIHGGINRKDSTVPLNTMWYMDLDASIWNEIHASNSPALSHHTCVTLADRYLLLIGGWDGKRRTSDVYVFDTEEQMWSHPTTVGFPDGAGLSSHTATLGANKDILLIGREGSLRTQRRSGNAYILHGDMKLMKYTSFPIGVDSRSGHTAHIIGNDLYVIGGRNDKLIERHSNFRNGDPVCTIMQQLVKYATENLKPMTKPPCGRKHHVGASGAGAVFIHGGETFDGRSREPVGEMFLMKVKPHMGWYKLGSSLVGRAGHSCSVSRDKIVIHGGIGGKTGTVYGDTYQLEI